MISLPPSTIINKIRIYINHESHKFKFHFFTIFILIQLEWKLKNPVITKKFQQLEIEFRREYVHLIAHDVLYLNNQQCCTPVYA